MKKELRQRPYFIIGSGRLSGHLQHYFNQLSVPFTTWNRSESTDLLKAKLSEKPVVLLAISDSAIVSFFETYLQNHDVKAIHFSGALHDPRLISCHPLMTFSTELYTTEVYKSIQFAITGATNLQEIFPELPNLSFVLDEKNKAFYHAWCVLSAAGTQTLWKSAVSNLATIGVPESAVQVYIQQIAHNFLTHPQSALTGPWVRNDQQTIAKNLQALIDSPAAKVYEALMKGQL